jgi:hypothetical protein
MVRTASDPEGPWLELAVFAEGVDIDGRNQSYSIVGIRDLVEVPSGTPFPVVQELMVFFGLLAHRPGVHNLQLVGKGLRVLDEGPEIWTTRFTRETWRRMHSARVTATFHDYGNYWYELRADGRLLTRLSLAVVRPEDIERPASPRAPRARRGTIVPFRPRATPPEPPRTG